MTKEGILKALLERRFLTASWAKFKSLFPRALMFAETQLAVLTLRLMAHKTPVEKDKIIFLTFRGSYDCNPKWICEEIVRRGLPYQLVWVYRKKTQTGKEDYPEGMKLVRLGTYEFLHELCSARIIVDNGISMVTQFYKKKKDQILIETWHGSLGIKKFSKDAVKDRQWIKRAFREGRMTDYIISNSDFETNEVYKVDYWKETPIWLHGHARNDILFETNTKRMRKIREKIATMYNLEPGTRICMYAPTFRDDHDMSPYTIDYAGLCSALEDRFGGQWVILARFHYRVWSEVKGFLKNVNQKVLVGVALVKAASVAGAANIEGIVTGEGTISIQGAVDVRGKVSVRPLKKAEIAATVKASVNAETAEVDEAEIEARVEAAKSALAVADEELIEVPVYKPLCVINATSYPDIQELAACTDVAITDYSSWICEYMVTRRPGFMFATDLKSYQEKDRPFFFPLTDLPYPVAYTSEELFKNIRNFDNDKCVRRTNEFLKKMGSVDDGHAAERTVDEIVKLMGEA